MLLLSLVLYISVYATAIIGAVVVSISVVGREAVAFMLLSLQLLLLFLLYLLMLLLILFLFYGLIFQ